MHNSKWSFSIVTNHNASTVRKTADQSGEGK
jgi:hypothetical protein